MSEVQISYYTTVRGPLILHNVIVSRYITFYQMNKLFKNISFFQYWQNVFTGPSLDTPAVAHYRISLAHDQHWEEQNTSTALLAFCMRGVCTHCPHREANIETFHKQLMHLVSIMQEHWIFEEKLRHFKSIRHLTRSNKEFEEDAQ